MKDYLYIGDDTDNSVKTFDAKTGRFLGSFVAPEPTISMVLEDSSLIMQAISLSPTKTLTSLLMAPY